MTAPAHSLLPARLMDEISDLIKVTRNESASAAMHAHVEMVSDVALLRERR